MRRDLRYFELPGPFARQHRPVRVHPHEKGLAAYVLDEYALKFFRIMATASQVPEDAVWSLVRTEVVRSGLQIVSGRQENASGFLVCDVPRQSHDRASYPVPPSLSVRAKAAIAALQSLACDLMADRAPSTP